MDAASVEQMNKIRKSLGLPLLPTSGTEPPSSGPTFKEHESDASDNGEPASTLETRESAGYENWHQLQQEQESKKRRDSKIAALKKARDASQRFAKLEGKGLGDAENENDLDARSWLKAQNKRMKKIEAERAERTAREQQERERLAAITYNSSDLAGVHVAHEIDDFGDEAGEHILTLKDKAIGGVDDDEDDELEARDLVEREALAKKLDLKRKRPAYDVHAVNEDGQSKILAQYDEDIDTKRKFTLDGIGNSIEAREAKKRAVGDLLQSAKSMISLNLPDRGDQPMSDYVTEVKIKKPKKEKKKKKREKAIDDEDIFPASGPAGDTMETDGQSGESRPVRNGNDDAIQDDEDLQFALAQSRRAAFKKKKRLRPEDLARELRAASGEPEAADAESEEGLVFDETTNFVENLQVNRVEPKSPAAEHQIATPAADAPSPEDPDGDLQMRQLDSDDVDEESHVPQMKQEENSPSAEKTTTGLDEEATLEQGLGATLNLLRQRGLVKETDGAHLTASQRQREFFLSEKRKRESAAEQAARAQREQDRKAGTFERMSAKDRQDYARFENSRREQQDQRAMAEFFNANYRPDVELKYVDELGRHLDPKEAFKHLSHQFHGKGSGKHKTEKRLKKIEDEKKKEAMSTLDSSQATGMSNAQGATAKKTKQAGVRLM